MLGVRHNVFVGGDMKAVGIRALGAFLLILVSTTLEWSKTMRLISAEGG